MDSLSDILLKINDDLEVESELREVSTGGGTQRGEGKERRRRSWSVGCIEARGTRFEGLKEGMGV